MFTRYHIDRIIDAFRCKIYVLNRRNKNVEAEKYEQVMRKVVFFLEKESAKDKKINVSEECIDFENDTFDDWEELLKPEFSERNIPKNMIEFTITDLDGIDFYEAITTKFFEINSSLGLNKFDVMLMLKMSNNYGLLTEDEVDTIFPESIRQNIKKSVSELVCKNHIQRHKLQNGEIYSLNQEYVDEITGNNEEVDDDILSNGLCE